MAEVMGKVLVVGQGEPLSNGGTKYPLVLDNGSQLVTFSERCKDAVGAHLNEVLKFETDPATFDGGHPKVTKAMTLDGAVLWEPSQGRGGGGGGNAGGDPILQDARTCVITAGALIAARANAYDSLDGLLADVATTAHVLRGLLKDVEASLRV